jgi:4-amino-4-deoxy-L-arabinose transferase-like glycosyltransferase
MSTVAPEAAVAPAGVRVTRTYWGVILTLLILAAAVRFWGLTFGLPLVQARPDEQLISGRVIGFFEKGDPNPRFFDYPTLYLYLLAGLYYLFYLLGRVVGWFQSFAQFVSSWPTNWVPFFLIGRLVGAVTGTLSVWLLYSAARRLIDRRVALLSAFFLSLAFLHVRDSHYGTTDVPMTCFALAAMLFVVRAHQSARVGDALVAGVFAGLAVAAKYSAIMLVAPMLLSAVIHVWDGRGHRWQALREARLHWMVVAMAAAFVAGSPFVVLDHGRFLYDMKWLRWSMEHGMTPPELLGIGWTYHIRVSLRYGLGLPLLGAALLGIVLLFVQRPRAALLWCAFPLAFYAATGASYNVFVRYMVPAVPFLCLTAAYFADRAGTWLARAIPKSIHAPAPVAAGAVAALLVIPSAMSVVAFDRLLARRDSRLVAGAWVREHVPAGSAIYYAGSVYGHLQLEDRRPFRYEYWKWDRDSSRFRTAQNHETDEWPEWIIVQQSPLPYSHVVPQVAAKLPTDYALVHVETAVDTDEPANVYDVQDAFFLPFAGFRRVERPGPNILIYRRQQFSKDP